MKTKQLKIQFIVLSFLITSSLLLTCVPLTDQMEASTKNNEIPQSSDSATFTQVWFKNFTNRIRDAKISSNGSVIALANKTTLEVYNITSNNTLWTYNTTGMISTIDMSDDGRYITLCSGNIGYLFDTTKVNPEVPVWTYDNSVIRLAISRDGARICAITKGTNKTIFLFGNVNNASIWSFYHGNNEIGNKGLDLSETGDFIAVGFGTGNGSILLFNDSVSATKLPIWQYNTGETGHQVSISADGSYITFGTSSGGTNTLYLFNKNPGSPKTPVWTYDSIRAIQSSVISADGSFIAANRVGDWTTIKPTLFFFGRTSNTPLWTYDSPEPEAAFDHLAMSINGTYLAAGTYQTLSVYLFDNKASASKDYLYHGAGRVSALDMSEDTKFLIAARHQEGYVAPYNATLYNITITEEQIYPEDTSDDPDEVPPDLTILFISLGIFGGVVLGISIYAVTHKDKMLNISKNLRKR